MNALAENWWLAMTARTKLQGTKSLLHLGCVVMCQIMSVDGECKYSIVTLWVNR